jgi:hypothetical protein
MPSTYKTPNFALNQWLGTDTFARTDFNDDNLIVDAALKRLSDDMKGIAPMANNLYNLILQQHYDGKYTGYKKALIFDGFQNYSNIAGISEGLFIQTVSSKKRLTFDNVGYTNYKTGDPDPNISASYTRNWTPEYCTLASDITLYFYAMENGTVTVTIEDDRGAVVGTATKVGGLPVGIGHRTYVTIPFSSPVYFVGQRSYKIKLSATSQIDIFRTYNTGEFYFSLTCSPTIRSSGSCVSSPADIGNDYTRAIGWVRHSGGAVGLGLEVGGSSLDFSLLGTYPAHTVDGTLPCNEAAFELSVPAGLSGETAVRLMLDKNGEENMYVYDYGVLFI